MWSCSICLVSSVHTTPVKSPTPHRLFQYVTQCLRLRRDLQGPGERQSAQIPAEAMLWTVMLVQILQESSFHALESLVVRRPLAQTEGLATTPWAILPNAWIRNPHAEPRCRPCVEPGATRHFRTALSWDCFGSNRREAMLRRAMFRRVVLCTMQKSRLWGIAIIW